ncbi:porin (plasmid) [Cupriavidus necator N-1]|uniref:Porin n=2 Tax=Cupriavidus necator TaxID=106590 RepID=F8GVM6_CUPNN|nr:porin [Cupriavidus necator N-1]
MKGWREAMLERRVCALAVAGLFVSSGAVAQSESVGAIQARAPSESEVQEIARAAAAAAKEAADAAARATAAADAAAKAAARLNAIMAPGTTLATNSGGRSEEETSARSSGTQTAAVDPKDPGEKVSANVTPEKKYAGAQQPSEDIRRIQGTEIYGVALPFFNTVGASGATGTAPKGGASLLAPQSYTGLSQASRNRIDGIALIGFRGKKVFSDDLSALYQVESSYDTTGDQQGTIGSRNSGVSLSSVKWGTALIGIWDTPYQFATQKAAAIRGNSSFDYGNVIGVPGFNVPVSLTRAGPDGSKADAGFNRRQGNIIQYWTPSIANFSARFAYSSNEYRNATTSGTSTSANPYILSASLSYDKGPLTLRYAYETHKDYFGLSQLGVSSGPVVTVSPGRSATNPSSSDSAHKLFVQYEFGSSRLLGIWERLQYENHDSKIGMVNQYERDAFYVMGQTRFGKHIVWMSYGLAGSGRCSKVGGAACSTSGLDGNMATLGYMYNISPTFDVYAAAFTVRNGASGQYGIYPTLGSGTAPGSTYRGVGVGVLAVFN